MCLIRILRSLFGTPTPPLGDTRIIYQLPNHSVYKKYYNQDALFADVDWSNWSVVVDGFEARFKKWYFDHLPGSHASYVDFCALCALVEVFSHYDSGRDWHEPKNYKEFLRKLDAVFRTKLTHPVHITRCEAGTWRAGKLKDFADVFYAGVRCSLHHHGDLASYAGMSGTNQLALERKDAGESTCHTHTYSLVVFDPAMLKTKLHDWLQQYCQQLRSSPSSQAATQFRQTFANDFGITIPEPTTGT
ncbi:MAG: hypothetical protein HQ518_27425 [Rhodopirellula sp.]|nr:hypothetical protein [Rhodopirellula sp.]